MEKDTYREPSPLASARRNGLIAGLLLIGFFLISNIGGIYSEKSIWISVLNTVVGTGIFMLVCHKAISSYRDDEMNGMLTYGDAFKVSALTVLIGVALFTVFSYIFMKFIDRSIVEQAREIAAQALEGTEIDDEQLETVEGVMGYLTGPGFLAVTSFFSYLVWGILVAAITSAIIPKNNPNVEQ